MESVPLTLLIKPYPAVISDRAAFRDDKRTALIAQTVCVFAGVAYGIVVIMALLLPETRGRELTAD